MSKPRVAVLKGEDRKSDDEICRDAAAAVMAAVPDIVKGLIEKAKRGSYLHAKFLFEFAQVARPAPAEAEQYDPLAALLLQKLGAPPEKIVEIAGRQTAVP